MTRGFHKAVLSLLGIVLLGLLPQGAAAQRVSVRNNILTDATGTPNLSLEIRVGEHVSLGVNGSLKSWPRFLAWDATTENPTHWRFFTVEPEARYYFDQVFQGTFLETDFLYAHFNMAGVKLPLGLYPEIRDNRLQGDFYGGGLSLGYSWRLSTHWRIEALAGANLGYVNAQKFECDHCGSQVGTREGFAVVPKLGISLAYNFKRRERQKQEILEMIAPQQTQSQPQRESLSEPDFYIPDTPAVPKVGPTQKKASAYPMLQASSEYQPYTPERVLRKEPGVVFVYFKPGKSEVLREFTYFERYRNNGPALDEILDATHSVLADTTIRLSHIQIVGLASIDDDALLNQRLALKRAQAIKQYIQEQVDVPDEVFDTACGSEAWSEFRDQVQDLIEAGGTRDLSVKQLQAVLEIVDNEPNLVRRKNRIMNLEKGSVYSHIARGLLQDQRSAGYVHIYYDTVPDAAAQAVNEAIGLLERGSYEAALQRIEPWRSDPRSIRIYAAALFYNGRREEAYDLLSRAAKAGDTAAAKDLEALQALSSQLPSYGKYLRENENINK